MVPRLTRRPFVVMVLLIVLPGAIAILRSQARLRVLYVTQPVGFFVAEGDPQVGSRPGDRDLARMALEAWQKAVGPVARLRAATEDSARLRIYWAGPRDGQYGEMRPLLVEGRAGAALFVRPDLGGLGQDIAERGISDPLFRDTVVFLTCVHELGHAFGLEHTADFRDIMYSFQFGGDIVEYFDRFRRQLKMRDDIARVSPMSDSDRRRARVLYVKP